MNVFRNPLSWGAIALAAVMAFVMMFAYLGAFIDPTGNTRALPLVLVNQDRGAVIQGRAVNLGSDLARRIASRRDARVRWEVVATRAQAIRHLGRDAANGGLVIPASYTARLLTLSDPRSATFQTPRLEALSNPAAGPTASATADTIVSRIIAATGAQVKASLTRAWARAAVRPTVQQGMVLADPVRSSTTVTTSGGNRLGRGLAPFYFAVMLTLAGLVGANIISFAIEYLNGNYRLDVFGLHGLPRHTVLSPLEVWRTKLILTTAMSVPAGILQTWMAVGILGMPASSGVALALFATLGVLSTALTTLFFLTLLGTAGALPAILFTTIFGVPSAGGVYPLQMVPGFFQFLGAWLPLRYLTDGTHAFVFFAGRTEAGLGVAVSVLVAYAIGVLLLSGLTAVAYDRYACRADTERIRLTPRAAHRQAS